MKKITNYKIMIAALVTSLTVFVVLFSFGFSNVFTEMNNFDSSILWGGEVLGAEEGVSNRLIPRLPESDRKILPPEKKNDAVNFELESPVGVIFDVRTGKIIFGKDENKKWSIGSITKLMTALVFLDNNPGWDYVYEIKKEDKREGGRIYVFEGEKIKVKDLFLLSLVGSANTATVALTKSTGMTEEEFVKAMNDKAHSLSLENMNFVDPVGLGDNNVATAVDVARLVNFALLNVEIREAVVKQRHEFFTEAGRAKEVYSTDSLLGIFPSNGIKIIGGKTGYVEAGGYCFAGKFVNEEGNSIISVIFGSSDKFLRFEETSNMVNWFYSNYLWRK